MSKYSENFTAVDAEHVVKCCAHWIEQLPVRIEDKREAQIAKLMDTVCTTGHLWWMKTRPRTREEAIALMHLRQFDLDSRWDEIAQREVRGLYRVEELKRLAEHSAFGVVCVTESMSWVLDLVPEVS